LEALIRYIYNFDYAVYSGCATQTEKAFFHLKVRMCAQKYLVTALVAKALAKFNEALDTMTNTAEIMAVIQRFDTMKEQLDIPEDAVESLVKKNLASLLELDLFPAWIGTQPKLCRVLLRGVATFETLEMHKHAVCNHCSKHTASGNPALICGTCGCRLVSASGKKLARVVDCWVQKGVPCDRL